MFATRLRARPLVAALLVACLSTTAFAVSPDHHEFEAMLKAPFVGTKGEARDFTMNFSYPDAVVPQSVAWRLELLGNDGMPQRVWYGEEQFSGKPFDVKVAWDGVGRAKARLADGHYKIRMTATAGDPVNFQTKKGTRADRVEEVLNRVGDEAIVQEFDIEVGHPARPQMPAFTPLPTSRTAEGKSAGAIAGLPYTVYFGNLHSQTNHSDGGGVVGSCTGAQNPQSGVGGPAEAFAYAQGKGLDILVASEHNHMFDGSDSTNTSASPTTAHNLYASGLAAESSYNAAHPNFLGVYGMEWGVISNGGHLNIFNSTELFEWEYNSSNQLIGDYFTPKSDYATLYTTMKNKGLVGQFNHPSSSGQFIVGGTAIGYSADGDAVMVLAEVSNTSAFSQLTDESQGSASSYESAFNIMLSRGFHVAPSTDQDNHCGQWGASWTNRTGVLIPTGTPLTKTAFIDALKARRVYATHDKNSQLILTANGHVMGERFSNSGSLTLTANYANTSGRTASTVSIFEGVPGSNGSVTLLASTATTTITPATGEHFYYVKIQQDDGKYLWSAPVWVSQGTSSDPTPPTVSGSESGTSGTITLSASASDNVGVTKVEFYVDNVLKGTDTTSPYSITLDSTTLTNASHVLTAKAFDAAGNSTVSAPVNFTISNPVAGAFTETESNGTIAAANVVGHSYTSITGTMGNTTDKDYFALSLGANEKVTINMTGPAGTDYDLYLVDAADATLVSSAGSSSTESVTYTNGATAKTVYAKVISYSGSSTTVNYTLALAYTTGTTTTQLLLNPGFESGAVNWTASSGVIDNSTSQASRTGSWKAWMDGYGSAHTDTMYQQVAVPSTATAVTFSFWLKVVSDETTTTSAFDTLKVQVRNSSGTVLATLATYSNLNKGTSYVQKSFDLTAYKGQTIRVYFEGVEGSTTATSFLIDDVSLTSQ